MTRSIARHVSVVLAAAFTLLNVLLSAAPASASSMWFSRSSGTMANASWLEVGELPNVPGNIHFGYLTIEDLGNGNAQIWGEVYDLTCPEGVIPEGPGGGHGEEEPVEPVCTDEGARFIDGGETTFRMDRKFSTATLTGTLNVYGHDGPLGAPAVDMTLTGIGSAYRSTESGTFSNGTETYSYRYSFSGRDATVAGRIGAMVFDNVEGEWSTAQMGSYRQMDRGRTN